MNYPTLVNNIKSEYSVELEEHVDKIGRGSEYIEGKLPQHRDLINSINRSSF